VRQGYFLVIFDEEKQARSGEPMNANSETFVGDAALETVVHRLEEELREMRQRLRATVEYQKHRPKRDQKANLDFGSMWNAGDADGRGSISGSKSDLQEHGIANKGPPNAKPF
jgi:hypothetical protein